LKIRGVLLISFLLSVSFVMSACFQGEQTMQEIDVPEETVFEDEENDMEVAEDLEENIEEQETVIESDETVLREIYLIDADGFVVPQMIELPKTESAALTTLQYMVKDGPVTDLLPNGFEAVLPANTDVLSVNLDEDGTLTIDLSDQFTNYEAKDEVKILEAMSHTMTQFDTIERIKLWINGEQLNEMPLKGTPISSGYSPKKGINVFLDGKPNLHSSKSLTVYYPKQYHDSLYHVPVTQFFEVDDEALVETVVETMMKNPSFGVQAAQVFNDGTSLVEKPVLNEGVLQLVFNEAILKDEAAAVIADEVMETLVKSLTEIEEVEAVQIKVKDKATVVSEKGTTYDRPVTLQDIKGQEKM